MAYTKQNFADNRVLMAENLEKMEDGILERILAPAVATVGQTIVVSEVDEEGKPIKWEAANPASGVGERYEILFNVEEAVESVEWDFVDDSGNPVLLQEVEIVQHFISTNISGADLNVKIMYDDDSVAYYSVANNYANAAGNWILAVSLAKVYGKTLYVLANKTANSSGSSNYGGGITKQGVMNVRGWGDMWAENPKPIKGIVGMKMPGAVGAKGQFYVCGVRA